MVTILITVIITVQLVCTVLQEVCNANNISDHKRVVDDAISAALLQQSENGDIVADDVTSEPDTAAAADSSDEQRLTDDDDDDDASLDNAELAKEDLWYMNNAYHFCYAQQQLLL